MQEAQSILAIDCGNALTSVLYIAQVEGVYRLLGQGQALSTHKAPWDDISLGILDAIKQIEVACDKTFLSPDNEPIRPSNQAGEGVDLISLVVSAAEPLQVSLVGLMEEISLNRAQEAISGEYISLNQKLPFNSKIFEQNIMALSQAQSDVIILVGGIDGGSEKPVCDLARMLAMALSIMPPHNRPQVIYAGNHRLRIRVAEIIGQLTTLKSLDNIQSSLDQVSPIPLQQGLEKLYIDLKVAQLPGIQKVLSWTDNKVAPAALSYGQSIRYLGQSYNINVIGADVGTAHTTLATQRTQYHHRHIQSGLGISQGIKALVDDTPLEYFERWLPFGIEQDTLQTALAQYSLLQDTLPQTIEDLFIRLSLLREILRRAARQARPHWDPKRRGQRWFDWDLIIGSGCTLSQSAYPTLAALCLIDGLEPSGICSLALDQATMLGNLGHLATEQAQAAVQIAGYEALLSLGTLIAPIGIGSVKKTAIKLKITYDDPEQAVQEIKIPFGTLEVFPLALGETAQVEAFPSRQFDLNPLGESAGKGLVARVQGGVLGLIIDTRGRPIILAQDPGERQRNMARWLLKLGFPSELLMEYIEPDNLAELLDVA